MQNPEQGRIDVEQLSPRDRRLLRELAVDHSVGPGALAVVMVEQYLRLLRDAPQVLPPSPFRRRTAKVAP